MLVAGLMKPESRRSLCPKNIACCGEFCAVYHRLFSALAVAKRDRKTRINFLAEHAPPVQEKILNSKNDYPR